jgi:hypothetical protein
MTPIVGIDDAYDRDYASDGISRFGAYVRQRAHLFVADWEPLTPVTFAVTLWTIATGPVMSPGYVRVRTSVSAVTCRHAEEPGLLLAEVRLRLPRPADRRGADIVQAWSDWTLTTDVDGVGTTWSPPDEHCRAALLSARLRVPIREDQLPVPTRFAALDVTGAKRAIAVICEQVNTHAAPVVAALRGSLIGAAR